MASQERFNLRSLYLYLVCLVALVIAMFAAVNLVRAAVELFYPDPGYYGFPFDKDDPDPAQRQQLQDAAIDSQRRQAVLNLVGSAATLLISAPVYAYHWKKVQQERIRGADSDGTSPTSSSV